MQDLLLFKSLRAFEAAGRLLNFERAAAELDVTGSAVRRYVKELEKQLGVALFDRHPRVISLTPAGKEYLSGIGDALSAIRKAASAVAGNSGKSRLAIRTPVTFARCWLIPRLPVFQQMHPEIEVTLLTQMRVDDGLACDADAEIRLTNPPEDDVGYDFLVPNELVPVCSPELLRTQADVMPGQSDRREHPSLLHSLARRGDWKKWLEAAGVGDVDPLAGLAYETSFLAFLAAARGHGVAIAQRALVSDDLDSGRLVAQSSFVLDEGSYTYYLIYCEKLVSRPEFILFRDWLLTTCSKEN